VVQPGEGKRLMGYPSEEEFINNTKVNIERRRCEQPGRSMLILSRLLVSKQLGCFRR
jgi:hypothetical protein